jgi:tetratricopeptide (TPR) repeat protein
MWRYRNFRAARQARQLPLSGILLWLAALLSSGALTFAQSPADEAQRALEAMAAGNYGRAAEIYSRLASSFPQNLDLKRNLALALHSAGRYSEALPIFTLILRSAPEDKGALLFSGIELTSLHEPGKAISNLTKFLEQDTHSSMGFLTRGRAYLAKDQLSSAIEDFAKAADLDPGNSKAWEGLGKANLLAGQQAFQFVEEHGTFSAEWYGLLARSYASAGDYKTAFRFFQEAESRAPDLPGVHSGLAEVYKQTGHADWAALELAKPEPPAVRVETELRKKYVDVLQFQSQGAEALARLARSPDTPEYHALLGLAYRVQHRGVESVDEFRQALALSPNSVNMKLELAISLGVLKDCDGAMPILQEVIKADPHSTEANEVLGECLVDQNRPQEAISVLKTALLQDPRLLPAELALGRAYLHMGDYPNAALHLRRAANLGDPSILYQLAMVYRKLGDEKTSSEYLARYKVRLQQVQQRSQAPAGEITPP